MATRIKLDKQPTRQPVKISKERIDAILKDIGEGSTRFHASEANSIAYSSFYYWVKQGQLDVKYGLDTMYAYLVKGLRKIEQAEIKECRKSIRMQKKGHKGKEWTLEKVYWQHFGGNAPVMALADEMELEKGDIADEEGNEKGSKKG
jgi:hypothetical protein